MMMKKTDEGGAENNVDTDKEALACKKIFDEIIFLFVFLFSFPR